MSTGFRLAPSDVQANWGFEVRSKRQAREKLLRHLLCGEIADKTIYASGVTDFYAAAPDLTRFYWEELCAAPAELRPRRIVIQTRFRPDRDAHLMARYSHSTAPSDNGPPVLVSYSIGTDRNDLIKAWERATPGFESRMDAIGALRRAGVFVVATLSPLGPWNNLQGTLERLKESGVAYVTVLFFKEHTGPTTTPKRFLAYLHRNYPELLDASWQAARVAEMRAVYGPDRVLVGQPGFTSLAKPQAIVNQARHSPVIELQSPCNGCRS